MIRPLRFLALLLLVSAIAAAGPSSSATLGEQRGTSGSSQARALLTFVTYRYVDPAVGFEAFRLLVPKGWQAEGAITWSAQPALPAQSHFRFFAPDRSEQLEFFPAQSFFWTDNRLFLSTNPPGSLRFGTPVAQPVSLAAAFSSVILPTFRPSISGPRIVERKRVPEAGSSWPEGSPPPAFAPPPREARSGSSIRRGAGRSRRKPAAVVSQFVTDPGGYFINYWYVDYVFAFKAGQGQLDAHSKTFQTMIPSLKVNPRWFAKVVNTKEYLAQMVMRNIRVPYQLGRDRRSGREARCEPISKPPGSSGNVSTTRSLRISATTFAGWTDTTIPSPARRSEPALGVWNSLGEQPRRVRCYGQPRLQPEHRLQPDLAADAPKAIGRRPPSRSRFPARFDSGRILPKSAAGSMYSSCVFCVSASCLSASSGSGDQLLAKGGNMRRSTLALILLGFLVGFLLAVPCRPQTLLGRATPGSSNIPSLVAIIPVAISAPGQVRLALQDRDAGAQSQP